MYMYIYVIKMIWLHVFVTPPTQDRDLVTPLLTPTAIIGAKYDLFQEFDPEKKKIISKTLRFVAHMSGASLLVIQYSNNNNNIIIVIERDIIFFVSVFISCVP